jgi:hypothetical protein
MKRSFTIKARLQTLLQQTVVAIKSSISLQVALFCVFIFLIYPFVNGFPGNIMSWDNFGYYLYLPQTFIEGDIQISNVSAVHEVIEKYKTTGTFYQAYHLENGNWVIKYSMGMAVIYLPFFLLGHASAFLFDYPMDGYSDPYNWWMTFGSFFYLVAGIFILRKVLLEFFTEKISAALIIIVVLGTNYYQIHTINHGMPHIYLFTLYALLVWQTIKWHKKPTLWGATILGSIIGIMILSRPSEIIAIFIPLFWGVYSFSSFWKKYKELVLQHWLKLLVVVVTIILVCLPQLFYWHYVTGDYIYYSYDNPGEGFEFDEPNTYNFLLSFRKGWLIYTPVMALAIIGLIFIKDESKKQFQLPILLFTIANIYLLSSWSTWWYASSFGQRSMIQSYALLALPLGTVFLWTNKQQLQKILVMAFVVMCLLLNQFQTWQYANGIIDPQRMTKKYYFTVFGKTAVPAGAEKWLLVKRSFYGEDKFRGLENYEEHITKHQEFPDWVVMDSIAEHLAYKMDAEKQFTPKIATEFFKLTYRDHAWVKVMFEAYIPPDSDPANLKLVMSMAHKGKYYKYTAVPLSLWPYEKGKWNKYDYYYLTPEVRKEYDQLEVYLWNLNGDFFVDNIRIVSYIRKW